MTPPEARSALQLAAWRLDIGLQPAEELVGLAVDALVAGLDGSALSELAGADDRDSQSLREVFEGVVKEQGLERGDEQSSLWRVVRHTAGQIVDGSLNPMTGAAWIYRNASDRAEPEGDLRVFAGLASEFNDYPDEREAFEREIILESALLLAREEPRRWLRLKAAADQPLSVSTTRGQAPMNVEELALPVALASRLLAWSDAWSATCKIGGFATIDDAERFVEEGRNLGETLQEQLGAGWRVEYYPEPIRPPGLRLRTASRSVAARAQAALRAHWPARARRRG